MVFPAVADWPQAEIGYTAGAPVTVVAVVADWRRLPANHNSLHNHLSKPVNVSERAILNHTVFSYMEK